MLDSLPTHVMHLPHNPSNNKQPLEVYGHDGMAYNITMQPGEMILYESHSVVHGRPFPLKGRYYANVFIHFEPVGHSVDHGFDPDDESHMATIQDIKSGFNKGLPPYIIDGSLEAAVWRRENPDQWEHKSKYEADEAEGTGANGAHYASNIGDVETLTWIIENPQHRTDLIHEHDYNGWLPIHEAARGGIFASCSFACLLLVMDICFSSRNQRSII